MAAEGFSVDSFRHTNGARSRVQSWSVLQCNFSGLELSHPETPGCGAALTTKKANAEVAEHRLSGGSRKCGRE